MTNRLGLITDGKQTSFFLVGNPDSIQVPKTWLLATFRAAQNLMPQMSAQQLSNLLWALDKLVPCPGSSTSSTSGPSNASVARAPAAPTTFLSVAASCLHAVLPVMSEQGLACSSQALARLGFVPDPVWLSDWASATEPLLRSGSSQAISCCLAAMLSWRGGNFHGAANSRMDGMLAWTVLDACVELARRAEADAGGREQAALLVALGALRQLDPSETTSLTSTAPARRQPQPQQFGRPLNEPLPRAPAPLPNLDSTKQGRGLSSVAASVGPPLAAPLIPGLAAVPYSPAPLPGGVSVLAGFALGQRPIRNVPGGAEAVPEARQRQLQVAGFPSPPPVQGGTPLPQQPAAILEPHEDSQPALAVLVTALEGHLQRHLPRYSPSQLATGLWALAQQGCMPDLLWLKSTALPRLDQECFRAGSREGEPRRHSGIGRPQAALTDKEVAMYTWAKARWALPLLSHVPVHQQTDSTPLASSLPSSSSRGSSPTPAASCSLGPCALVALLHAAGRSPHLVLGGGRDSGDRQRLEQVMAQLAVVSANGLMSGRSLSTCLWASARLGYRPPPDWQSQLWHALHSLRARMSAGELLLSLWALASMRCRPSEVHAASALRQLAVLSEPVVSNGQQVSGLSGLDACRLLQAASTWRLQLPPALWRHLLLHSDGPLAQHRLPGLPPRQLLAVVLHAGRLGLPLQEAWLSAAYRHCLLSLHALTSGQLVSLMEATSFLQAQTGDSGTQAGVSVDADHRSTTPSPLGAEGQPKGCGVFHAALHEMESRGLAQSASCSEDARFLRCLVMHRRQTRWLGVASLDATLTSFFIVSRSRVAAAAPQQLLHVLFWLAQLNVVADEAWLRTCSEALQAQLQGMSPDELSWSLAALLRCGLRPGPNWVGLYMGIVLQRMPVLQPRHLCRITAALAQLDERLHAHWSSKLAVSYS